MEQGFALAHFLVLDRTTALQTLTSALNKLKAKTNQERRRAYWREKFLKRQITRITRDDEDTLQWLIYVESDVHEMAQEALGQASEQDMVVRYIKALVRLSTGMSSFYAIIAIHRLLHQYTTSETQKIYEFVSDSYREADEYRRAKLWLMLRLETRFGERINRIKADRGETRFALAECQGMWRELVRNCLERFTPWSTQAECPLKHRSDLSLDQLHEALGVDSEGSGNPDKIEINRCHAFIDPVCSDYIAGALGLEQHSSKLGVPRFDMDADRNIRPSSFRLPHAHLTAEERQAIADALSTEEARRKRAIPRELSFVIDGVEHARSHLEQSRELEFSAPVGYQLVEIWTQDEQGPLLLGTQIAPDFEHQDHVPFTFRLALQTGLLISILVRTEPGDEAGSSKFSVSISGASTSVASRVHEWLAHGSVIPAYAWVLVLLFAVGLLGGGLSRKLATERIQNRELRRELDQERQASASSRQSPTPIPASAYRLTPDDLITRGSDEIQKPAITVPEAPVAINLELPVPNLEGQYRVALKPFEGRKVILAEEELPPIQREGKTIIVMPVPSTLLKSGQYYRVELNDRISRDFRTFTFYTTPAQP